MAFVFTANSVNSPCVYTLFSSPGRGYDAAGCRLDNYTGRRTNNLIKTRDDHNLQKLNFDFTEK